MSELEAPPGSGVLEGIALGTLLPHRFPFLLVDRVLECVPGSHIVGLKNVTSNEPLLSEIPHAPRVLTHLLVVESLAQLSMVLALHTLGVKPTADDRMLFAGIDSATFMGEAMTGDQVILRSDVTRIRKVAGKFAATASVNGRAIVEVSILAAIQLGS